MPCNFPFRKGEVVAFHADARKAPLGKASVNLALFSPPYINVLNYHQQHREAASLLGITRGEVLETARSEIGANRKNRENRFLTVIQYSLDMAMVFRELLRVCAPLSRVVMVVGRESTVQGVGFSNPGILAEIAYGIGFLPLIRQERAFVNRYGEKIVEDILHFLTPREWKLSPEEVLNRARGVAVGFLEEAYSLAAEEAREGIRKALNRAESVEPSPIFSPKEAREKVLG